MLHPTIAQQLAAERQRDLLDHASRHRQARTAQAARSARGNAVSPEGQIRLHQQDGQLLLDLPAAAEAVVPQPPHTWSGSFWSERPSHQPW